MGKNNPNKKSMKGRIQALGHRKKLSQAEKEAVIAKISYYLLDRNTKKARLGRAQSRKKSLFNSGRSSLPDIETTKSRENEPVETAQCNSEDINKDITQNSNDKGQSSIPRNFFSNSNTDSRSNNMANVATLASNCQKFANNTNQSRYSQKEQDAILARVSLYLLGSAKNKSTDEEISRHYNETESDIQSSVHPNKIRNNSVDGYNLRDGSNHSKNMAEVAVLANNCKKFSENSKYSHAEREAILAKISLYLMQNKRKDSGAN